MTEFDHGPSAQLAELFDRVPDPPIRDDFWFDWGPVFYRGRLDGSARVLCVASDPGPTERIAGRTLVGNAGQRVQGFLTKLGLTRSYVCVNAWAYAVHPSRAFAERDRLDDHDQLEWRNELYDAVAGPDLEAVIAFGFMAQAAVALWSNRPDVALKEIAHPSNPDEHELLDEWRSAVGELREIVTPDDDGDNAGPNYGTSFREADYAPIPARDLPFGAPAFLGDDRWVRDQPGGAQNSVARPSPDDGHTLIWRAPETDLAAMESHTGVPDDRLEAAYRAGVIEEQPPPPPEALAAAPPPTLPLEEPVALRGAVLAPGGAIEDGYVVVDGSQIEAVEKTRPEGVRVHETDGVIGPGLIDLHGHPEFNIFAAWEPPKQFINRYAWRGSDIYRELVRDPQNHLLDVLPPKTQLRYAEIRALVGGVTAIQGTGGQATAYQDEALVRNVDKWIFGSQVGRALIDLRPRGASSVWIRFAASSPE